MIAVSACAGADRGADRSELVSALGEVACAEAVADRLVALEARIPPRERPLADGRASLAFPTAEIGRWVVVQPVGSAVAIAEAHPAGGTRTDFDERCASDRPMVLPPADAPPDGAWTDEELSSVIDSALARGRRGVAVYAWSPHMPLSLDGGPAVIEAARRMDLDVYGILTPGSDRAFARTEAERLELPEEWTRTSASLELAFRDLWVHAPALLVFSDGRVSPVMPGYRDADRYVEFLEDALRR